MFRRDQNIQVEKETIFAISCIYPIKISQLKEGIILFSKNNKLAKFLEKKIATISSELGCL
jgi:hypothetical protein